MQLITIIISKNKLDFRYLVAKYLRINKFNHKFIKITEYG